MAGQVQHPVRRGREYPWLTQGRRELLEITGPHFDIGIEVYPREGPCGPVANGQSCLLGSDRDRQNADCGLE